VSRSIETLVGRQIRRWEAEIKARDQKARQPAPSIAFSRLVCAGGEEVARRVSERLEWGFFGREIVEQIEREHGLQHQLLAALDERVRGMIDRYVKDSVRKEKLTESDYLRHVVATLRTLGEGGMVVILGRGAPFILSADRTLRVLIVAPDASRAERLAKERGLPIDRAREQLASEDEERRDFLRQHFQRAQEDARHYDLVLNTSTLGNETAASLVIEALRGRFPDALRER
jgi:cytidylate kinase